MFGQVLAQSVQVEAGVDAAQEVALRNVILEVEGVATLLYALLLSHHSRTSQRPCGSHIVSRLRFRGSLFDRIHRELPALTMPICTLKTRLGHEWPESSGIGRAMILEFGEFGRHRRVAPGQLLDRHILSLVVRKTKVSIRAEQGILGLLQVVD